MKTKEKGGTMFQETVKRLLQDLASRGFQEVGGHDGAYTVLKPYHPVLYLVDILDGDRLSGSQVLANLPHRAEQAQHFAQSCHCSQTICLTIYFVSHGAKAQEEALFHSPFPESDTLHTVFWLVDIETGQWTAPPGQPTRLQGIDKAVGVALGRLAPSSVSSTPSLKETKAPLTMALIVFLFAVFIAEWLLDPEKTWVLALANTGTLWQSGEVWRLLTSMFLHGGWLHLLCNCVTLYVFASLMERAEGKKRFLALYFLSGLAGNLLSSLLLGSGYAVGASGAIFGLVGAFLVFIHRAKGEIQGWNYPTVLLFLGVNLVMGFVTPQVDVWAHVGGLAAGVGLEYWWSRQKDHKK